MFLIGDLFYLDSFCHLAVFSDTDGISYVGFALFWVVRFRELFTL